MDENVLLRLWIFSHTNFKKVKKGMDNEVFFDINDVPMFFYLFFIKLIKRKNISCSAGQYMAGRKSR